MELYTKHILQCNFVFQKKSGNANTPPTIRCICLHMLPVAEMETLEVPPFSPSSKEVLGQAVQASFAGFSQERSKHHFPHGRTTHWPNTVDSLPAGWAVTQCPVCLAVFRPHAVVWVGGELLAGLVPERVWPPLPGLPTERSGRRGALWPEQGGFPGPDPWLHCTGDPLGAPGGHERRSPSNQSFLLEPVDTLWLVRDWNADPTLNCNVRAWYSGKSWFFLPGERLN